MRYLTLLKSARPDTPPPPGLLEAIVKLGEEATASGTLLDTAGLAPTLAGSRITVAGGDLSVTDGPFTEAKEIISYALYEVRDKAEVVEWTARFMRLHRDMWPGWQGEADILKVFGPEDFAPPA